MKMQSQFSKHLLNYEYKKENANKKTKKYNDSIMKSLTCLKIIETKSSCHVTCIF